jgi:hypothetical protein
MVRILYAASLLAAVASAASPPETCPATHVVYKTVYVDENGAYTGDVDYRGPYLINSGSGSSSSNAASGSSNSVAITKPKSGSHGSSSGSSSGSWTNSGNDGGASYQYYGEPAMFRPAVPPGVRSWSPQNVVPKPQGERNTLWFGGAKYQSKSVLSLTINNALIGD